MGASVPIPVNLDKSGGRTQPGVIPSIRREAHWQLYANVDPDVMHRYDPAPSHIQRAMEEVFGTERLKDVKLARHPLLGYWSLWERVRNPESGQVGGYRLVSMFYSQPVDGYLPQHLRGNKWTAHLTGQVGEPREPTRRDFEIIEQFDIKKYGYEAVENRYAAPEIEAERELERVFHDRIDDFLDYHFWLAMRDAQAHHSRPWSTPTVEYRPNGLRWAHIKKDGYTLRVKFGSREHRRELEDLVTRLEHDRDAFESARGLRRDYTRADYEAEILATRSQIDVVELEEQAAQKTPEIKTKVAEWHCKVSRLAAMNKAVNGGGGG